jgi:hypothetical protein
VRTKDDIVDVSTGAHNQVMHFCMHCRECIGIEKAPGEPGLIACNGDGKTRPRQRGNRVDAAVQGNPLISGFYEVARVAVDHSIAIENDQSPVGWSVDDH